MFPSGLLPPPFFHESFDDAVNYGAIGSVIAHEFTHAFDDQGLGAALAIEQDT